MTPAGAADPPGGGPSPRWGPPARALAIRTVLALVLLSALGVVLAAGSAGATLSADAQFQAENDTTAPTVGNLTTVDKTTVELVISDDTDVVENTIEAGDLRLSAGTVGSVDVDEAGTDATVTISLAEPIDSDRLSVGFTDDASITDAAGNELDTAVHRSTTGMDGVAPTVAAFTVESAGNTTVTVTVTGDEPLNATSVVLDGPETVWLGGGNYTASNDGRTLTTTTSLPAAGNYTATLRSATDASGNTGQIGQTAAVATDERPPTAVASIDFGASSGRTITVDGSRSTAEDPIESVTWDLGDGAEAEGERVTHRFRPGNYTVTLTVTDADGDVGTDRLVLDLQGNETALPVGTNGTVAFGTNATNRTAVGASAVVDVAAPADTGVVIARTDASGERLPVAASDDVTLEALTVELTRETRYGLAVQLDGPATVADVGNATSGRALAGLTVLHDVPDDAVREVSIEVGLQRARLADYGDGPDDVRLFRYHNGSWTGLETVRTNASNGTVSYRATAPGLSRFAVATDPADLGAPVNETHTATPTPTPTPSPTATATETPEPRIGVANASLNRSAVDPGQAVGVSATIANDGEDVAGFTAGLTVNGTVVDSQTLTVPPGGTRPVALTYTANETGSRSLVVNGTTAGTVTVGGGGGILGTVAGLFGFLPLGLLQTAVTYLGGVLVAAFLALKSVALLLGY